MTGKVPLRVLELSAPDWQNQQQTALQGDPVTTMFDWMFEANRFDCAVLAPTNRILKRPGWPRVLLAEYGAASERAILEKATRSGFRLVICTRVRGSDLVEWFGRLGYHVSGRGIVGSGDQSDPIRVAWNKKAVEQILGLASRLCDHAFCLFGHDADPVYVLHTEDSEDRPAL